MGRGNLHDVRASAVLGNGVALGFKIRISCGNVCRVAFEWRSENQLMDKSDE